MKALWQKYHFVLFIAAGLGVIGFGMRYYLSPITRLELYGVKLDFRGAQRHPVDYLVGWQSQLESWTEREDRLDTPLTKETLEEVATLRIERSPGTPALNYYRAAAQEWIRTLQGADGVKNQTIPLNHPSIAPGELIFDKQGTLVERVPTPAWRVARALPFIVPRFPKGVLRRGHTWTEQVEWSEAMDDWKIGWKADVHWQLEGFEERDGVPAAHLVYEAALTPAILQEAFWAKGTASAIHFSGQTSGDAYYNVKDKLLLSDTFSYTGAVKILISNLQLVPEDLRVGASIPDGSAGAVVLKLSDRMNVQLP